MFDVSCCDANVTESQVCRATLNGAQTVRGDCTKKDVKQRHVFRSEESLGIGHRDHRCRQICCRLATPTVTCRGVVSSIQSFGMCVVLHFAISIISP